MAGKAGQIIPRGERTWLVRVFMVSRKGAILAPHPFAHLSLLTDHLRTVLAVKGSLRRAQQRRALDCSGPFQSNPSN